ncbi:MAG TPA: glycosyltransferase family 2 protein [Cyanobacteria bacterium UBA8803]|nr:glycosyltransferase family 2 protein [Cyanobacteria bacterium UBA8803]
MNRDRVAVLITCHNRKPKTLACLDALFKQVLPPEVTIEVYLVDDGSSDGTAEAVHQTYPQVQIIYGDGNLYWNGGMRLAFAQASEQDYDYYLWLNDDTLLYPDALGTLLTTSSHLVEQGNDCAIVVGSAQDPDKGIHTYGGVVKEHWWHPFHFRKVKPKEVVQQCDSMNGNCVLIPRSVVQVVGNLDPVLTHYAGDYDYGLRAQKHGCTVWIAPGYAGTCSSNTSLNPTLNSDQTKQEQLQQMSQPKGLPLKDATLISLEEWKVFTQRHGGLLWPIYWLLPYRRLLLSWPLGKRKRN